MGRRDYRFECTPSSDFVSSGYTSTPAIIAILAGVVIALNCVFIVAASVFFAARRAMHASQVLQQTNAAKGEALRILRKSQAVAESHNQSKTDFLAFLCHELRNPVRTSPAPGSLATESDQLFSFLLSFSGFLLFFVLFLNRDSRYGRLSINTLLF